LLARDVMTCDTVFEVRWCRPCLDQVEGDALCCTTAQTGIQVADWLRKRGSGGGSSGD